VSQVKPSTAGIRDATRGDIRSIVSLLADDPLGQQREAPASLAAYVAAYDAMACDPATQCFVAVDAEDTVIGYVQMTVSRHLSYQGARRALLEDLRVAASCRRAGIGEQLVRTAIAAAQTAGCDLVQLLVHTERDAAHHLYRKLGFRADHLGLRLNL